MRVMLARRCLPAVVVYSEGLPEHIGGMAQTFVVVIHPKYRDDRGIHQHELEHVKQWYVTVAAVLLLAALAYFGGQFGMAGGLAIASIGTDGVLYRRWRRFRLWSEAAAYARQMRFPDRKGNYLSLADATCRLCSPRYDLRVSPSQVRALIAPPK